MVSGVHDLRSRRQRHSEFSYHSTTSHGQPTTPGRAVSGAPPAARDRPAAAAGRRGRSVVRDVLLRSWPGRLFLIAALLKLVVAVWRRARRRAVVVQILSSAATLGLVDLASPTSLWRLFVLMKRRLLWRVRRKLILSYIFIGVVPSLLIIVFFLLGAGIVSMNVSAYLFKDGYDDVVRNVAADRGGGRDRDGARRRAIRPTRSSGVHANSRRARRTPACRSLFVPAAGDANAAVRAGPWDHAAPPRDVPAWIKPNSEVSPARSPCPLAESPGRQ